MAIKEWKPEFSNSNEVAPEQPSNLRIEESKNTQETWKPSLNIPSHKPTQKELNKEVTDEFSSREEAEKWLNSPEQQNLSQEAKQHIRSRFDRAFGGETKPQMSDYDLFKSIHYTPDEYGRTNYVEGEEEEMWNKLGEHFDLPKYESNKYSFLVNDKDKSVRLSTRGESDGLGFGGWKEKPQDLGQLKRKQDASSIDFSKENDPAKLVSFIEKNMGNNDAIDSFNDAMERLEKLVPFTDKEYDILDGGTGEQIMEVLNSKIKENKNTNQPVKPEKTQPKPIITFNHSGINFEMSPEQRSYFDANPKEFKELLQQAKASGYDIIKVAGNGKGWSVYETSDSDKNREIIENAKREPKFNLNDAFNNAGLPQFVGKDVNTFSKNDIRKIKDQIAKNDSSYKENWKDNPQRKALVDIVNDYAETYRNPSLFIDENEITNDSALSNYLKKNVSQSEYDENVFETEDGEEYLVVDEDKARQYAEDDIRSTIDDLGLQAFSRNFQDWIVNNAIDSNWLEQIKEEEADYFENEGDQETAERYRNMSDDELINELKGMYGEQDFASFVGENIDWNKVIDEAISWDGIAHFIASYDGKEIELPNGLYAYRIN